MSFLNYLLSAAEPAAENSGTILEKLGLGVSVTLLGLIVVFVALVLIIFCISCMTTIMRGMGKKSAPSAPAPAPKAAPAPAASPAPVIEAGVDPKVVAAISAAIACFQQEEAPEGSFVVRSIRRAGNAHAWNR